MSLFSREFVKDLLKTRGISPSKGLGQNFLVDKDALEKIVASGGLNKNDTVLEIGPGPGVLTAELAKTARRVVAVEKDPKMVEVLKETTKGLGNVEIIQDDALKLIENWKLEIGNCYKVVANLPYYITSPVIRQFLEAEKKPELLVLLVQKEVAERICAKPPDMSLLAVSVQFYATPKIIARVKKDSFWPKPKVDSAVMRISDFKPQAVSTDFFFKIVKAGFSQPRKQLLNNLSNGLKLNKEKVSSWLLENGIDPKRRAETLSVGDWTRLVKYAII